MLMSDPSDIRQLAYKRGIDDQYYEYIRFSDFRGGFDGFISRLLKEFNDAGIYLSEEEIVEKILPISKYIVKNIYEKEFIDKIIRNARDRVRGDFIATIVEKIVILFSLLLFIGFTRYIDGYLQHKLAIKKLKDYKEFFKNELNMPEEQLKDFLVRIAESVECKSNSDSSLIDSIKHVFLK